jgi:TRAP-type C4-dicarboxylate transport system permease small subunit
MERLAGVLERGGLAIAAATLAIALLAMVAQVVSRYVIGSSLIWAEELARYALIWSAMVGAAVAYRRLAHVGMSALLELLPDRPQRLAARLIHLLVLSFVLVVAYEGWFLALRNFARDQLSPALQVPIAWAYLAVPVGAFLIALAALEGLWRGRVPLGR